jgi:hypothetical protein
MLLILLCASGSLAFSQQHSSISVDAAVGFSGVFRAGAWTPVRIFTQNLGQDIRGTLSVRVARGNRFGDDRTTVEYTRDLELVSGASKAFSFVLPLETTVYPVVLQIREENELVFEQQIELSGKSAPGRLVTVLARRPNLDFLLPLFNSREERALDIAYPLIEFLPHDWHGYDGVDVLVIQDARLAELSTGQTQAIKSWIAAGGRLVISGGTHLGPADSQALAPLISLTPAGIDLRTVESVGLLEAGLPLEPVERTREVVVGATLEYGQQVSRTKVGAGDIVFLPFDYVNLVRVAPLSSVALWSALLTDRSALNPIATEMRRRVFEDELMANQLALPVYQFPGHGLVIGLFVSYLIALGTLLFWLQRGRSAARRMLGLPLVLLAITLVAGTAHLALTVSLQPDEALAFSLERVNLRPGEQYASVTRDSVLFSRQAGRYELSYPSRPLVMPLDNQNQMIRERTASRVAVLETESWGHSNALAIDLVPLALRVDVEEDPAFAVITLQNQSDLTLRGITFIHRGFPQRVGDLQPGETVEVVAEPDPVARFEAIDWDAYVDEGELRPNRIRLLGDIGRSQYFADERAPSIMVVAWLEEELIPVEISPPFSRTLGLGVLTIPVWLDEPADTTTGTSS